MQWDYGNSFFEATAITTPSRLFCLTQRKESLCNLKSDSIA